MGHSRVKSKNRKDAGRRFAGIPHTVMNSSSYQGLSGSATKLLLELARQYNGKNNGDLTVSYSVLKDRGFNSKETIARATQELVDANLIVQTRIGEFRNPGAKCSLYGLTWQAIDECFGKNLDIGPTNIPYRKFSLEQSNIPGPVRGPSSSSKSGRPRARDLKGRYTST